MLLAWEQNNICAQQTSAEAAFHIISPWRGVKVKLTDWDGHMQIYTHTAGAPIGHNAMVRTLHVCVSIPRARVRSGQWGLGWQRGRGGWKDRADEREGWRRKVWGHCGNRGNHSVMQQVGLKMLRRQRWKRSVDMTDETIRGWLLIRMPEQSSADDAESFLTFIHYV